MLQDPGGALARDDVFVRTAVAGDDRALAAVVHSAWTWDVGPVPLAPRERPFSCGHVQQVHDFDLPRLASDRPSSRLAPPTRAVAREQEIGPAGRQPMAVRRPPAPVDRAGRPAQIRRSGGGSRGMRPAPRGGGRVAPACVVGLDALPTQHRPHWGIYSKCRSRCRRPLPNSPCPSVSWSQQWTGPSSSARMSCICSGTDVRPCVWASLRTTARRSESAVAAGRGETQRESLDVAVGSTVSPRRRLNARPPITGHAR